MSDTEVQQLAAIKQLLESKLADQHDNNNDNGSVTWRIIALGSCAAVVTLLAAWGNHFNHKLDTIDNKLDVIAVRATESQIRLDLHLDNHAIKQP